MICDCIPEEGHDHLNCGRCTPELEPGDVVKECNFCSRKVLYTNGVEQPHNCKFIVKEYLGLCTDCGEEVTIQQGQDLAHVLIQHHCGRKYVHDRNNRVLTIIPRPKWWK